MSRVSFRYTAEAVEFYRDGTLVFVLTVEGAVRLCKDILVEYLTRFSKEHRND